MSSKRQTTMAKLARERAVKAKRELKREKKQAASLERAKAAEAPPPEQIVTEDEAPPGDIL